MAAESSFAKSQLEKHGWEEGRGLGKKEHGIRSAIKVAFKNDTRGVGHDPGEEFAFHWWDHVFNKAANNIKVQNAESGDVSIEKEDDTHISNKRGAKTFASKSMLYGRFVRGAILNNDEDGMPVMEESESSSSEEEEVVIGGALSDEQLFKVCGGRTAHKGARHGLKLNGKLARIAEQEKLQTPVDTPEQSSSECTGEEKKKKRKKRKSSKNENDSKHLDVEEGTSPPKKKKRSKKQDSVEMDTSIASKEESTVEQNGDLVSSHKKKKKKKSKKHDIEQNSDSDNGADQATTKNRSYGNVPFTYENTQDNDSEECVKKKKKKSKKSKKDTSD